MSKIVVLTTQYLGIPSANGICARNIVCELKKMGNEVCVVCFENNSDNKANKGIYPIRQCKSAETHSVIQKITRTMKVALGSTEPLINHQLVNEYLKSLKRINKKGKIDLIIAMYFPFETVEAMYQFKEEFKDVKTYIYELDSIADGVAKKSIVHYFYNKRYDQWLREVYSGISATIIMKTHEEYWRKEFFPLFPKKLLIADLPVLTPKSYSFNVSTKIRMIYSGVIDKRYRSPSYLLKVLESLSKKIEFEFDFYSKGNCEDELVSAANLINGVKHHGYVTPAELDLAIENACFLVNIGNAISRSVPSKLITYISYGKPIIHFALQKNDVCIDYLRRYKNALIIDQSNPVEISVEQMFAFLTSYTDKHIPFEILEKEFYMNDPKYSANLICRQLGES